MASTSWRCCVDNLDVFCYICGEYIGIPEKVHIKHILVFIGEIEMNPGLHIKSANLVLVKRLTPMFDVFIEWRKLKIILTIEIHVS